MKKKDEIKKHVISMSEYLMSVVNSVAKEFLDKNPSIKVLLEKTAKIKKEKVEKIKKEKKTKLEGGSQAIKIKIPGAISHIPDIKWKDPFKK